jgi:hypothetical protein
MSNRPGLGFNAVEPIVEALFSQFGKSMLNQHGDVPNFLISGGKKIHLDRYIRSKLQDGIGVDDTTKQRSLEAFKQELFLMYMDEVTDPETGKIDYDKAKGLKKFIQDKDAQQILNIKTLTNIYKRSRNL